MAGIKELRLRIKSLRNTSKITAAMKMVSAARLKKAQDAFARSKPYAESMEQMLARVLASADAGDHPLAQARPVKRVRYVLVSSDRGLCGSFNNGLFKAFLRRPVDAPAVEVLGLGRRARDLAAKNAGLTAVSASYSNVPQYSNAASVAQRLIEDFRSERCDRVVLVYNRFLNALSQQPVFIPVLPFAPAAPAGAKKTGPRDDYFLEPDAETLFTELLPKLVALQVFRALLENAVGEHSARMAAMDNATKNTKELIGSLTLSMNRARQAAITRELIEIVSGAEALKG